MLSKLPYPIARRLLAAVVGVMSVAVAVPAVAAAAANERPECGSDDPPLRIRQDAAVTTGTPCFDPNGDSLTLHVLAGEGPRHGTVTGADTGAGLQMTYTPEPGFRGVDSFRAVARDAALESAPFQVDIVVGRNHAPTCALRTMHARPGQPVFAMLTCTDADMQDQPPAVSLDGQPANGTATDFGFRMFRYTPNADFITGADEFGIAVTDGLATTRLRQRVHVDATAFCSPEPLDHVRPGATRLFPGDCTEPSGASAPAMVVAAPAKGSLTPAAGGFSYTAGAGASGSDRFTFKAAPPLDSPVAEQQIALDAAANRLPTCDDTTPPQPVYLEHAIALAPRCSDADGDPLVFEPAGDPAHGSVTVQAGALRYTPDAGFTGLDVVSLRVGDGFGVAQGPFDYVVESFPPEKPTCFPVAPLAVRPGGSRTFSPDCRAPQGGALEYVFTQPAKGSVVAAADGKLTYSALPGTANDDYFDVSAENQYGTSGPVRIGVVIDERTNATPVCTPASNAPSLKVARGVTTPLPLTSRCSDADGDVLTFHVIVRPEGTITPEAPATELSYRSLPEQLGADEFVFVAGDGHGGTSEPTVFAVDVLESTAPTCTAQPPMRVAPGGTASVTLQCADPNLATVSYRIDDPPDQGLLIPDGASFEYAASDNATGTDRFVYHAEGPGGTSHTYTQDIVIETGNQEPSATIDPVVGDPFRGEELVVTADATDPDGTIASITWEVVGDECDDGTGAELRCTFETLGPKTIRLHVTDDGGLEADDEVTVQIVNRAPTVQLTAGPASGLTGQDLTFTAAAADADPAPAPAPAWELDGDGDFDDATGATATTRFATAGTKRVQVRATDDAGDTALAERTVTILAPETSQPPPTTPSPAPDTRAPVASLKPLPKQRLRSVRSAGFRFVATCDEPCTAQFKLLVDKGTARRLKIDRRARGPVTVAELTATIAGGQQTVALKLTRKSAKAFKRARKVKLTLVGSVSDAAGNTTQSAPRTLTVKH